MRTYLDFEKPIAELESKVAELKTLASAERSVSIEEDIAKLENKARDALVETYASLTPWQKTQVARHPERPHFRHYIDALVQDFTPLSGDRFFAEDQAILGGIGRFTGRSVMVIGHEKGSDTEGRIKHNFGMARPEGYRKAQRIMELADRFGLPVISLVDTPGAYPGIGAEERGQSEAIGRNIFEMAQLEVPIITTIIGEGGSGGALAISVADQVLMLQYSVYSVISPEGCASILWKTAERASDAADALGITAHRLKALGVIDKIVSEPVGGAHRDTRQMAVNLKRALNDALRQVFDLKPAALLQRRYDRLQSYGRFSDTKER
jgi:acetyl-CoA carboxylase carboxyl transferase subunit alpha